MKEVAVLFARSDSVYKTMPGCDVWDIERDARMWPGGAPVVAHPPCRAWGRLQHFAKPRDDERELALFAVDSVRQNGGILEHPAFSDLWIYCCLPAPGKFDLFGGFTLPILQQWWGHRAAKATWLYVAGCSPSEFPRMPLVLGEASHVVSPSGNIRVGDRNYRPQLRKSEREHTPPALAEWLVDLARRCAL